MSNLKNFSSHIKSAGKINFSMFYLTHCIKSIILIYNQNKIVTDKIFIIHNKFI